MKYSGTFILILALGFVGCGRGGNGPRRPLLPASTGYYDQDTGVDYVHNGDTRVDEALKDDSGTDDGQVTPPAGDKPKPGAPIKPIQNFTLHDALKEFEISRYDEGATDPSRFGSKLFRVKFFMKKGMGKSIEFRGAFGGAKPHLTVEADADGYHLSGFIDDQKEQNKGEFVISKAGDTARIFYWAYRAKMNVREDRMHIPVAGSFADQQITSLRKNFGWVHNWTVARGRAFYMVDIVCLVGADAMGKLLPCDSTLSFKGESLRTGEQIHKADVLTGAATDVTLVGNSENTPGRSFSVSFADPGTKELNEVMIDIDLDAGSPGVDQPIVPDRPPVVVDGGDNTDDGSKPDDNNGGGTPTVPVNAKTVICEIVGGKPVIKEVPNAEAYLNVDFTNTGSAKVINDFNQNACVEGVRKQIDARVADREAHEKRAANENDPSVRDDFTKFLMYANPFRKIIDAVGTAFDVSSAFSYLTVVESRYFTGGNYVIQRPKRNNGTLASSALGPFQILEDTAAGSTLGMKVTDFKKDYSKAATDPVKADDSQDERR